MSDDTIDKRAVHIELTAEVIAAYVSNNAIPVSELSTLILETYTAMSQLSVEQQPLIAEKPRPAVPIRKSVTPDFLICLEDGRPFKSLKRHLATHFDMTPEQYREKWNLPSDYPMVAPNYSATRSSLAKKIGLGRKAETTPQSAKPAPRKKLGLKFT